MAFGETQDQGGGYELIIGDILLYVFVNSLQCEGVTLMQRFKLLRVMLKKIIHLLNIFQVFSPWVPEFR